MYFNSQQLTQLISCKHVELRFNLILNTINFVYGSSSDVSVMFLLRTITKVNQSTYVPEIARWSRQCWSIVVRRHSRWVNKRFEIETWKFLLIIDTYLYYQFSRLVMSNSQNYSNNQQAWLDYLPVN